MALQFDFMSFHKFSPFCLVMHLHTRKLLRKKSQIDVFFHFIYCKRNKRPKWTHRAKRRNYFLATLQQCDWCVNDTLIISTVCVYFVSIWQGVHCFGPAGCLGYKRVKIDGFHDRHWLLAYILERNVDGFLVHGMYQGTANCWFPCFFPKTLSGQWKLVTRKYNDSVSVLSPKNGRSCKYFLSCIS